MLLHKEPLWLIAYFIAVVAAVVFAITSGWAIWSVVAIAIVGSIVAFYGWLFQVGRFG